MRLPCIWVVEAWNFDRHRWEPDFNGDGDGGAFYSTRAAAVSKSRWWKQSTGDPYRVRKYVAQEPHK
jgi:hypothetical protein